jgi:steroid delta-isomerase-like uncharacterized protein
MATLLAAASACQPPAPPAAPPDYAATLGPAVDKLIEVWNNQNYDELDTVMTADVRRTAPNGSGSGIDHMKEFMKQLHAAYPDFHIVVDESAYKENLGFIEWTVTGTSTGDAATKATGKPVKISGVTMFKFRDGKIAEEIAYFDNAALLAQLGNRGGRTRSSLLNAAVKGLGPIQPSWIRSRN